MMETETRQPTHAENFIGRLTKYVKDEDRAVLAHFRRGLGKEPGTAMEMYPYIARFTNNLSTRDESAYFLVASLVGLYPTNSWKSEERYNNLGKSLSFLKDESDSIESRFVALLNSDDEDLPNHLRQIMGLLKSKEAPINWYLLLKDIQGWSSEKRYVQRNWAKGFWGNINKENIEKGEQK